MLLRPILSVITKPSLYSSSITNSRTLRPSIKIGKDKFQLSIDVHRYKKDEIRVRAHPEYVVIEGKHEMDTEQGYVLRQFIRKFKLPEGCVPGKIKCELAPDGMLTVIAPRAFKDSTTPAEVVIVPINYGKPDKKVEATAAAAPSGVTGDQVPKKVYRDPCKDYLKVKPKTPK